MRIMLVSATLAVWLLASVPANGQTSPETAGVTEELEGIRRALDRLVSLQESASRYQAVDLVLKRIELKMRSLEPLERRLRGAENDVENAEEHLKQLARMLEQNEDVLQQEVQDGTDARRSETRRMLDDIRRTQRGAEERLDLAYQATQRFENELADGRRELEILDDRLDELVEGD